MSNELKIAVHTENFNARKHFTTEEKIALKEATRQCDGWLQRLYKGPWRGLGVNRIDLIAMRARAFERFLETGNQAEGDMNVVLYNTDTEILVLKYSIIGVYMIEHHVFAEEPIKEIEKESGFLHVLVEPAAQESNIGVGEAEDGRKFILMKYLVEIGNKYFIAVNGSPNKFVLTLH